jgi:hypothetical protein
MEVEEVEERNQFEHLMFDASGHHPWQLCSGRDLRVMHDTSMIPYVHRHFGILSCLHISDTTLWTCTTTLRLSRVVTMLTLTSSSSSCHRQSHLPLAPFVARRLSNQLQSPQVNKSAYLV